MEFADIEGVIGGLIEEEERVKKENVVGANTNFFRTHIINYFLFIKNNYYGSNISV